MSQWHDSKFLELFSSAWGRGDNDLSRANGDISGFNREDNDGGGNGENATILADIVVEREGVDLNEGNIGCD